MGYVGWWAAVAVAALAFGGAASARTQLLVVGPTATAASGTTTLEVRGAAADAAWAEVTTYVPSGYTINLGHASGTRIGTVQARAGATAPGVVLVADAKDPTVQQAAARCTQTSTHAAVWLLRIGASAPTFDVPVFVDPTAGGESGFGSAKLVFCLPASGTRLSDLKLTFSAGVFTNPHFTGSHVWRTLVTAWRADGSGPDLASTVEAQAIVNVPSSLALKAKVRTTRRGGRVRNSVLLSGTVLEALRGVAGATVSFFANSRNAGSARTNATGAFGKRRVLARRTTYTAIATVPTREQPCVTPLPPALAPGGCVSATRAGYRIGSNGVTATPSRR
jgi:hypothetical protein